MAKVFIEESTLTDIGNAIRGKIGDSDLINTTDMATTIDTICLPAEAFSVTGDCSYRFSTGGWDWFLKMYGNQITTQDVGHPRYMFSMSKVEEIPFEVNITHKNTHHYIECMFDGCNKLKELPIINIEGTPDWNEVSYGTGEKVFRNCECLTKIREENLPFLRSLYPSNSIWYNQQFYSCHTLGELRDLPVGLETATVTNNKFSLAFGYCQRLKDIIFLTDNGTPYVRKWHSQIIDLTLKVGYGLNTNSRKDVLPLELYVSDDATYQANKNEELWYSDKVEYSRYNKQSALNTINSLPDTSAYLATQSGRTNTIKFTGNSGSATDAGAINTLTEEEIAIATAKGWTVTFA